MIGAAACVRTGPTYLAMILMYGVSVPFYGAQWDEYMTGEMKAGNGLFGVTEGQLSLVAIYAAASVLGEDMIRCSERSFDRVTVVARHKVRMLSCGLQLPSTLSSTSATYWPSF